MPQVLLSAEFEDWLDRLKDVRGRIKIVARIRSMTAGNFGDAKALVEQVSEMRIHYGPGYGSITRGVASRFICFWSAATSRPSVAMSRRQSGWRLN